MQYRAADRSLLEIQGDIDYNAPAIQVLYSPITGVPITLNSLEGGGYIPRRWRIIRVLEYPPPNTPTWTDTVNRIGGSGNLEDVNNAPLPSAMSAFVDKVKGSLGATALPVAIIAGGIFLLVFWGKRQ